MMRSIGKTGGRAVARQLFGALAGVLAFSAPALAGEVTVGDEAASEETAVEETAADGGGDAAVEARGDAVRLGYVEDAAVGAKKLAMKAKLDTGADTSSIHAYDVRLYTRGEKDNWVTFRLIGKDGRTIRYDQNVIRFVHIKAKRGGTIRRPVIHLPLCVGGVTGLAEINLADRGEFEYDILIGREFLAHRIVVDSGRTFAAEQSCESDNDE
ncbi:MAG: ATP-dependent zinc protease [Parvularculaceae bacterium]|nr:ATP-dependent zinc protease [Parvularculaceae bacterium]